MKSKKYYINIKDFIYIKLKKYYSKYKFTNSIKLNRDINYLFLKTSSSK